MQDTAQARLPGNPMMWILIGSEIAVFGAALLGFAGARILDTASFSAGQATLDRTAGAINTGVLLTSGLFAALAVWNGARKDCEPAHVSRWALLPSGLVVFFAAVKLLEYRPRFDAGIGMETNTFYHALFPDHRLSSAACVGGHTHSQLVAIWDSLDNLETGAAFWHMVDLIWVLIFPIIYIIG